jgi:hypothetical protein
VNEWVTPTGSSGWTYPERGRDDNMGTSAYACLPAWTWSGYIEFTHAALDCNKIRLYITRDDGTFTTLIAEVYYDGAYHEIFNGTPAYGGWNELPIGSLKSVTKMRFNVYHTSGSGYPCVAIYECDFWWGSPVVVGAMAPSMGAKLIAGRLI